MPGKYTGKKNKSDSQGCLLYTSRRGETFVTRKISLAAARIAQGEQDKLYLGNLDARRDWGLSLIHIYLAEYKYICRKYSLFSLTLQ